MARPDKSQFVRWSDESSHVDRRAALPEELGAQILKKEDIATSWVNEGLTPNGE